MNKIISKFSNKYINIQTESVFFKYTGHSQKVLCTSHKGNLNRYETYNMFSDQNVTR